MTDDRHGKWHPGITGSSTSVMHWQDRGNIGHASRTTMIRVMEVVTMGVEYVLNTSPRALNCPKASRRPPDCAPTRPTSLRIAQHQCTRLLVVLAKPQQINDDSTDESGRQAIGKTMGMREQIETPLPPRNLEGSPRAGAGKNCALADLAGVPRSRLPPASSGPASDFSNREIPTDHRGPREASLPVTLPDSSVAIPRDVTRERRDLFPIRKPEPVNRPARPSLGRRRRRRLIEG